MIINMNRKGSLQKKTQFMRWLCAVCLICLLAPFVSDIPASAETFTEITFAPPLTNFADDWFWPVDTRLKRRLIRGYESDHFALDIDIDWPGSELKVSSTYSEVEIYAAKDGIVEATYSGCKNFSRNDGNGQNCRTAGLGCALTHENSGYCNEKMGNGLILSHEVIIGGKKATVYTRYAHLTDVNESLKPGTPVKQGQVLGHGGSSGNSGGPHLHFVVSPEGKWNGSNINPPRDEYVDSQQGLVGKGVINYIYELDTISNESIKKFNETSTKEYNGYYMVNTSDEKYKTKGYVVAREVPRESAKDIGQITSNQIIYVFNAGYNEANSAAPWYYMKDAYVYSKRVSFISDIAQLFNLTSTTYTIDENGGVVFRQEMDKNGKPGSFGKISVAGFEVYSDKALTKKIADVRDVDSQSDGTTTFKDGAKAVYKTTPASGFEEGKVYYYRPYLCFGNGTQRCYGPANFFTYTINENASPTKFRLHYSLDGGNGFVLDVECDIGSSKTVQLPGSNTITRDGYLLAGWSIVPNDVKPDHKPGANYTLSGDRDITLHAVWVETGYKKLYNFAPGWYRLNTSYAKSAPIHKDFPLGIADTIDHITTNSPLVYIDGGVLNDTYGHVWYVIGKNPNSPSQYYGTHAGNFVYEKYLYRVPSYDVYLDLQGGTGKFATSLKKFEGVDLDLSEFIPTRSGYSFNGWSFTKGDSQGIYEVTGEDYDGVNLLYAVWVKDESDTEPTTTEFKNLKDVNKYFKLKENAPARKAPRKSGAEMVTPKANTVLYISRQGVNEAGNTWYQVSMQNNDAYPALKGLYIKASHFVTASPLKITYDANGGSDAPAPQQVYPERKLKLSSDTPTRDGYNFLGWSKKQDAEKAIYSAGNSYSFEASTKLYAVWSDKIVKSEKKINSYYYVLGKNTADAPLHDKPLGSAAENGSLKPGTSVKMDLEVVNINNNIWYQVAEGEHAGKYVWSDYVRKAEKYTISCHRNDLSSKIDRYTKLEGMPLQLVSPARSGYIFLGWSDNLFSKKVKYLPDANYSINSKASLYAVWTKDNMPFHKTDNVNTYFIGREGRPIWDHAASKEPAKRVTTLKEDTLLYISEVGYGKSGKSYTWYKIKGGPYDGCFIYAGNTKPVSFRCTATANSIATDNAVIRANINALDVDIFSLDNVDNVGLRLYSQNGVFISKGSKKAVAFGNTIGMDFNIQKLLGSVLKPSTVYRYEIYATIKGSNITLYTDSFKTAATVTIPEMTFGTPEITIKSPERFEVYQRIDIPSTEVKKTLTGMGFVVKNEDGLPLVERFLPPKNGSYSLDYPYIHTSPNTEVVLTDKTLQKGETYTYQAYATANNGKKYQGSIYTIVYGQEESKNHISINTNGGTGSAEYVVSKDWGESLDLNSYTPTREGYTFVGWSTNPDAVEPEYRAGEEFNMNLDTSLYAVWKQNQYTISYDANGGSNAPEAQQEYVGETAYLSDDIPVRSGYSFAGWATSPESQYAQYAQGGEYMPEGRTAMRTVQAAIEMEPDLEVIPRYLSGTPQNDADVVLYAIWAKDNYSVEFDANGGMNAPEMQVKLTDQALVLRAEQPTRNGYDFLGWSTDANVEAIEYLPGDTYSENASCVMYAIWKPHTYAVVFDPNGGSGGPETADKLHDKMMWIPAAVPEHANYTFIGWAKDRAAEEADYLPNEVYLHNESTTLYALWEIPKYTIVYNFEDKDIFADQIKLRGEDTVLHTAVPFRTGYTFLGWDASISAEDTLFAPGSVYNEDHDVFLDPKWARTTYTVSFDSNGGTIPEGQQIAELPYGYPFYMAFPSNCERDGYVFEGWYTDPVDGTPVESDTYFIKTENITLYAHWTKLRATGVELTPAEIRLNPGRSLRLNAHVVPSNAPNLSLIWESSNEAVAIVSSDGVVTAIAEGNAIICVTSADGGHTRRCSVEVCADDAGQCGDLLQWSVDETGTLTITGSGDMWNFEQADINNPFAVPWINHIDRIKAVRLPEGLRSIGAYAFNSFTSLKEISIPDSVRNIGSHAFQNCTMLESIVLPDRLRGLSNYAFAGCTALQSIKIPQSISVIWENCFSGCASLVSVELPEDLEELSACAFEGCALENIIIPEGLKTIHMDAFRNCAKLHTILFTGDVPTVDNYKALSSTIGAACTATNNSVPPTVKYISVRKGWGAESWQGCPSIPDTVVQIELTEGDIFTRYSYPGGSLKTDGIWLKCVTESGIHFETDCGYTVQPEVFEASGAQKATLCIDGASVDYAIEVCADYGECGFNGDNIIWMQAADGTLLLFGSGDMYFWDYDAPWGTDVTRVYISEGIQSIANRAFYNCRQLSGEVLIPASVKTIEDFVFVNTSAKPVFAEGSTVEDLYQDGIMLSEWGDSIACVSWIPENGEIVIPEGVKWLWDDFAGCEDIRSIKLPLTLEGVIGYNVFSGCDGIEELYIPANTTEITDGAFEGMGGLRAIEVDEGNPNYTSRNGILYNKELTQILHVPQMCSGEIVVPDGVSELGKQTNPFRGRTQITSISLPESLQTIPQYAFAGCSALESVVIRDGVTEIGKYAFNECKNLLRVEIPASVSKIGDYAFGGCWNLENVYIENLDAWMAIEFGNRYSYPNEYAEMLYAGGEVVREVVLPAGSSSIGMNRYTGFDCITRITIPEGIQVIGPNAFYSCAGLMDIVLPESLTSIGNSAFEGCYKLGEITLPDGLIEIGNNAFKNCKELKQVVFNKKLSKLGDYAFQNCSSLEAAEIPEGIVRIGTSAFDGCTVLNKLLIPDGLVEIGNAAFMNCINLSEVVLPCSVSNIGQQAFRYCTNLEHIYIQNPAAEVGAYVFSGCEKLTEVCIPGGTQAVEKNMLENCASLQSIQIHEGVASIGSGVFAGEKLVHVSIPSSVTSISGSAFNKCTALEHIVVDENNGKYASDGDVLYDTTTMSLLYAREGLTGNYSIAEGILNIGNVFRYCSNLEKIEIPASVTSIGSTAFEGCAQLNAIEVHTDNVNYTSIDGILYDAQLSQLIWIPRRISGSITLPEGIASIRADKLAYRSGITSLYVPASLSSIGDLTGCSGLKYIEVSPDNQNYSSRDGILYNKEQTSLLHLPIAFEGNCVIPEGIRSIPPGAGGFGSCFQGMEKLKHITLLGIESIPSYAFSGCTGLTGVVLANSVQSIGDHAFLGCSILDSIVIPGSVNKIDSYAFCDCSRLENVVLSEGIGTIYPSAFKGCISLKNIYIPASAQPAYDAFSIGKGSSLESITVHPDNPYYASSDGVLYNKSFIQVCRVPNAASGHFTVPDGITHIASDAFLACEGITSVTLPASLTSLGWSVFKDCKNLKALFFMGDLPADISLQSFAGAPKDMVIFYTEGTSGWTGPRMFGRSCCPDNKSTESFVTQLSIAELPAKLEYIIGEKIDLSGLKLLVEHYGAEPQIIEDGFVCETAVADTLGSMDITIRYADEECIFTVNVSQKTEDVLFIVDGKPYERVETALGSIPQSPKEPSKFGYIFAGWNSELTEVAGAGETYEAVWEVDPNPDAYAMMQSPFTEVQMQQGTITLYVDVLCTDAQQFAVLNAHPEWIIADESILVQYDENAFQIHEDNAIVTYTATFTINQPGLTKVQVSFGKDICAECNVFVHMKSSMLLPAVLTAVEKNAFSGILAEEIILPSGIKSIDSRAFADCEKLQYIIMPDSVISIANDAFEGSDSVGFICESDNSASAYARKHHIPYWIRSKS